MGGGRLKVEGKFLSPTLKGGNFRVLGDSYRLMVIGCWMMLVGCWWMVFSGWDCFVIPLRCIPRNGGWLVKG